MKDRTYLPVGTPGNFKMTLINKGDILQLATGEKITFTEMKRVKFWGKIGNQSNFTIVPVWRDRSQTTPFATAVVGRDESVITVSADIQSFTPGELFSLEGHKETFMYAGKKYKKGKEVVAAIDVATGRNWSIDLSFTYVKIDLEKIKTKIA